MANTVTLLPFLRQGTNSMLYAYFANFAPGQQLTLTTKILQKVGVHTGVHLSSVRRYIQKQPQNRYFIIKKEGLFFTVIRSDLVLNGQKVAININKLQKYGLTLSETVVIAALSHFSQSKKKVPTRHRLAYMTGFSLRQISYAFKSLASKKLIKPVRQEEQYVRTTKREGRVEDIRQRKTYELNNEDTFLAGCFKSAPLKKSYRNPVIKNNRSFKFDMNKHKKSFLHDIWKFYGKHFKPHSFESLQGLKKFCVKNNIAIPAARAMLAIIKFRETPFLKVAHGFGWSEAVVEMFNRQKLSVGLRSKYLEKYRSHKPGLGWILKNIDAIIKNLYAIRCRSGSAITVENIKTFSSGKAFQEKAVDKAPLSSSLRKNLSYVYACKEIMQFTEDTHGEKAAHFTVLKWVGSRSYLSWLSACVIRGISKDKIVIKAPSAFHRAMIEAKIILPLSLERKVTLK